MQLMPRTAKAMGVKNTGDPAHNIKGGIKYLDWLRDRFDSNLPISERLWFTLAAYNAGAGHVHDARRLARQLGYDPDRWFDHTEQAMLLLSKKGIRAQGALRVRQRTGTGQLCARYPPAFRSLCRNWP